MLKPQPTVQTDALRHLEALISRPSITPVDAGCQDYLARELQTLGFNVERYRDGAVSNLIASRPGKPSLAFSGHTDVVPAGEHWQVNPFALTHKDGYLYGRGIADMKGGIAAFLVAIEQALAAGHALDGLMVLLTSDEEGEAEDGSQRIVERLQKSGRMPPWVLVGEPTGQHYSGDTLRIGRRGALSGELHLTGRSGHVAYQAAQDNVLHRAMTIGSRLAALQWPVGAADFPGTGFHLTGIEHGGWLDNVTPGHAVLRFNLRYCHRVSRDVIAERVTQCIDDDLQYQLHWSRPCEPYFSEFAENNRTFLRYCEQAVQTTLARFPVLSTAGGASDGRFFAGAGAQVIELGLPNRYIHQANERVALTAYQQLIAIYQALLVQL